MSDSTRNDSETLSIAERHPSVYRIWQQVRAEGGTEGEMMDRYRELLEKYGHRDEWTGKW